ncbi:FprA family A-type flavoprotein [uncultured Eubacterium sp.]|uniref:FprA family A-type flavoprotein n=1 Tax=uncultured Eubacterium sp. TaxID=165185 RepID=UPI002670F1D4|nr:FprA family A-type flavoprotein [uncultured Eubacterium sp.]
MEKVTNTIINVGVNDYDLTLFESQYMLEKGMAYNSYVILDDKVAVMDTVDGRATEEWLKNLDEALAGRVVDYVVVQHMEPDHSGSLAALIEKFPEMKIVGNAKTFPMMKQFFDMDIEEKQIVVSEGDTLKLGSHTLTFIMAPMVHWPEVMVTYESSEKVLFSADGFGKFGTRDADEDWTCEARRYYFNIVGKYGMQVQMLLKKAAAFDIQTICPLHGPVLTDNLEYYIEKYDIWSKYEPEDKGVFIAHASIHGNTAHAAEKLKQILEEKGCEKVAIADLCREDMHEAVEDAFRYDRLVLAASSYDAGVFPPMEKFLHHLKIKNYQKRTVAIIENGSWAPTAARTIKAGLEGMKEIQLVEPVITIKSSMKPENVEQMNELAEILVN